MMRRMALAAAQIAAVSGNAQAPLSVDASFRMDLPAQNAYSLACMPNGQLLVSGNLEFPGETNVWPLGRINPDGSRDMSFPFTYGGAKLTPWQDRYYVAGSQTVRRLMPDGTIDNSFQHMNFDPYFSSLQGGDYHVFPDGRVLLGGYHTIDAAHLGYQGGYNLVWFFSNGRLDTTRVHRTGDGTVWRIQEYPPNTAGGLGGKFLVHHWGTEFEGQPVSKVIRVHADGSLDETFNAPIPWGYVWAMEPLPDGRAYIGGTFRLENQSDTIQLIRVMPDGSLDPTFNNGLDMLMGEQFTFLDAGVSCIFPIGEGLLAVTGLFSEVDGNERSGICMLDTTGNFVPYYFTGGGCGSYQYQIGQMVQTYGSIDGIIRAPSGDYYIWGAYHGYSDGTTNDTLQRMVTRLHGGEIGLGVPQAGSTKPVMRLYPNPASTTVVVELGEVPRHAELVLRDALGRVVLRRRLTAHATAVELGVPGGVYMAEVLQSGRPRLIERLVVEY
ncbi:MAG TPA: T9SS type A sorting domain-containing protein [Flavobacteriales bacterium]|nr:T9SS type A sorting domain-containing protein [Flavobacteriales bacterium]